jgi:hypothetical protein
MGQRSVNTLQQARHLRMLHAGGWEQPLMSWYDADGWTAESELRVSWARSVASGAEVVFDATRATLLGVQGSTAYRHPCGCLALGLLGAQRMGRQGVDVRVSVDLIPR